MERKQQSEQPIEEHPTPGTLQEWENIDALAAQLTGNGWTEPRSDLPPAPDTSQPITVEAYFTRYLRKHYPEADDEALQHMVRRVMDHPEISQHLANLLKTELEIREQDPGWQGGWLGENAPLGHSRDGGAS